MLIPFRIRNNSSESEGCRGTNKPMTEEIRTIIIPDRAIESHKKEENTSRRDRP